MRPTLAQEIICPLDTLCSVHNLSGNFNCEQQKKESRTKATVFLS